MLHVKYISIKEKIIEIDIKAKGENVINNNINLLVPVGSLTVERNKVLIIFSFEKVNKTVQILVVILRIIIVIMLILYKRKELGETYITD